MMFLNEFLLKSENIKIIDLALENNQYIRGTVEIQNDEFKKWFDEAAKNNSRVLEKLLSKE